MVDYRGRKSRSRSAGLQRRNVLLSSRRKPVLWLLLGIAAVSGLWLLNLEITYRRNVRNLPADFQPRRHTINRIWKT